MAGEGANTLRLAELKVKGKLGHHCTVYLMTQELPAPAVVLIIQNNKCVHHLSQL